MKPRLAFLAAVAENVAICIGCGGFLGLGVMLLHIAPSPPPVAGVMIGMGLGFLYPVLSGDGLWPKSAKREEQLVKSNHNKGSNP
jgi:hypothetical protein